MIKEKNHFCVILGLLMHGSGAKKESSRGIKHWDVKCYMLNGDIFWRTSAFR